MTPDKKNAMMVAGMNLKMRDDNADYPALRIGDFIFNGGFLKSRLAMRIRQKEGIGKKYEKIKALHYRGALIF